VIGIFVGSVVGIDAVEVLSVASLVLLASVVAASVAGDSELDEDAELDEPPPHAARPTAVAARATNTTAAEDGRRPSLLRRFLAVLTVVSPFLRWFPEMEDATCLASRQYVRAPPI
jgi:hypothetical protein